MCPLKILSPACEPKQCSSAKLTFFICIVVNSDGIPKETILLFKCILETIWKMISP